ncbi:MAG TPA: hypothetical protein DC049_19650 [Spirochaetia bacterium]|nr:hypothetical protein [Spirochaetia bacterium]
MSSLLSNFSFNILRAGFAEVGPDWSKNLLAAPHNRLYLITGGEADMTCTDNRIITMLPDHIYLFPVFSLKSSFCRKSLSHYYLNFHADSVYMEELLSLCPEQLPINREISPEIITLFNEVTENHKLQGISAEMKKSGALLRLLSFFFKDFENKNAEITGFSAVINYIERNLKKEMTVQNLAALMGLSVNYFSDRFNALFGNPPRQYIIKKRLELACMLLFKTDKKIREIAAETGFPDESYFTRIFRKKNKMSPMEYRNRREDETEI